jgi:hypothetical protein
MVDPKLPNKPRIPSYDIRDSRGHEPWDKQEAIKPIPKDTPPVKFEAEVEKIFNELQALLLSKHKDYGPKNIADAPGGPLNGLRVRMHDKLARINNLVDKDINPEHESLEDSFRDMANYAIIGLLVQRGLWPK